MTICTEIPRRAGLAPIAVDTIPRRPVFLLDKGCQCQRDHGDNGAGHTLQYEADAEGWLVLPLQARLVLPGHQGQGRLPAARHLGKHGGIPDQIHSRINGVIIKASRAPPRPTALHNSRDGRGRRRSGPGRCCPAHRQDHQPHDFGRRGRGRWIRKQP